MVESSAQWTPDGKRVVLLANLANDRGVGYVELDVETGDIKPFLSDLFRRPLTPFAWSPDGQFVYVFYDRAIIRVEIATERQTRLLELPPGEGLFRGMAISSNGQQLALAMDDVVRVVSPTSHTRGRFRCGLPDRAERSHAGTRSLDRRQPRRGSNRGSPGTVVTVPAPAHDPRHQTPRLRETPV